jgi:YVTN family beta-propeller protein
MQVDLIWTDNSSDESAFRIERSPDGSSGWTEIASVGQDVTAYSDPGLECGTTHYYRVRAYRDGDGQYSDYSNTDGATTFSAPLAPSLSAPADGGSTYETTPTFDWLPVSSATAYRLQVDDNADFSSPEIDTATPNTDYMPGSPLLPGTYSWRVWASNACGDGPWSVVWSLTIESEPQDRTLTLASDPGIIPPDGLSFSMLTAEVLDPPGVPAQDGTVVVYSTTLGTFPGGLTFTPRPTGVMTVEAESTDVGRVGAWVVYSDTQASDGRGVYSNGTGDKVTYTFTGTAISVIFQKQFNAGIAHVYLDSVLYREIDTYWDDGSGSGKLYQQEELIAEDLPYAPHQVEVVVTGMQNPASSGAYLVVDALRVHGYDRNGAYLTSGGVSTITLTSAITPGTALITACAGTTCDTEAVHFRELFYLPLVLRNYPFTCMELVENGGFEDNASWEIGATPRPARYSTERAHSGSRSMLLGLKPNESDVHSFSSVQQTIALPADADSVSLTFWTYPMSDLDSGDRQDCLLLGEEDELIAVLMRDNVNSTTWIRESYDLTAYAGQTVKVYLNAYNDGVGEGLTGFYLDDVSVQACKIKEPPQEPPDCYPVLEESVGVGQAPRGVAINGDYHRLYVTNHGDDTLSVINAATYNPHPSVDVGDGPSGVAYDPTNRMIYVANGIGNTVTVLRASNYELMGTIPVGAQPKGIAVNPVTNRVYVANYGSGTVSVIDGATHTVSQTIAVGTQPSMVAVNPVTNKAYVSLHGEGSVAVIDSAGVATHIDIYDSSGSYGITVDTVHNLIYVATIDTARIVAIDGHTDTFLGWAEIKRMPGGEPVPLRTIAVNPLIGTSGHIFATTTGEDGGWNQFLLLPKGWPEYYARPHALSLNEPRDGIAFEPTTLRVYVTSRSDDLLAAYLDGEPTCPANFAMHDRYQITVCVANGEGICKKTLYR